MTAVDRGEFETAVIPACLGPSGGRCVYEECCRVEECFVKRHWVAGYDHCAPSRLILTRGQLRFLSTRQRTGLRFGYVRCLTNAKWCWTPIVRRISDSRGSSCYWLNCWEAAVILQEKNANIWSWCSVNNLYAYLGTYLVRISAWRPLLLSSLSTFLEMGSYCTVSF